MNTSEKATLTSGLLYYEFFKMKTNDSQFRSFGHGWQKIEKKKNTSNRKAQCIFTQIQKGRLLDILFGKGHHMLIPNCA